tara:strand:- start:4769 stop:5494 length:726 start_codon:yes stop_codon:yes gene_type:complete
MIENSLNLNIKNFSGSLDVLLELAKTQKVDLAEISVTELADQFNSYISKSETINLDLASEYLLMASWLTYLKSKLLLPESEEEEFKALEVAEKLKIQLKKLELIRLLSDSLLKKKKLGVEIFLRGQPGNVRPKFSSKYTASLYEILKSYSDFTARKSFKTVNILKLPVFTTEQGIATIKSFFGKIKKWVSVYELIPNNFKSKNYKKTGIAGIFSASLELAKEGKIEMEQKKLFDPIYIKEK